MDGLNDNATCLGSGASQGPYFNPTGFKSLAFWIKRYNTNSASILVEASSGGLTFIELRFNKARTNCFEYRYLRDTTLTDEIWSSEPELGSATNVWLHFVLTHNSSDSNSVALYVNGVLKTGAWTSGATTGPQVASWPLSIGNATSTTFTNFFGEMESFTWYLSQLLTPYQVQLIYRSRVHQVNLYPFSQAPFQPGIGNDRNGRTAYNPFDGFPAGSAPAAGSVFRDIGVYDFFRDSVNNSNIVNFVAGGGIVCQPSVVNSYLPNE